MKKLRVMLLQAILLNCITFVSLGSNPNNAIEISSDNKVAGYTFKGALVKNGEVIVKVKAQYRNSCTKNSINDTRMIYALQKIQCSLVEKKFPHAEVEAGAINKYGKPVVDLSLMYRLRFSSSVNMEKAISVLKATDMLEYAEPMYIHYLDYIPNDPSAAGQQYFLAKINAYNAWDITKGDTNVVIGIVDSGTDWDHPDLQANIKYNWNDPIDGIDNDLDGFVDNFRGWDISENDNDPMNASSNHGSHVSGCANAVTDNGVGVAGPAFNCKFLPVKSSLDLSASTIDDGYDGIIYAAEHGANIINCSWGRTGNVSEFEQDIITHVTLDLDRLVVAAAGNDASDEFHYPSSYKYALSVASTDSVDRKSSFSNYGYSIDVCAPGSHVYSTVINDSYTWMDGTSMASPIAAGCAAIVKSKFPSMNALQIGEQLKVTCDNIYSVSGNTGYRYKLGRGRVNLFAAVTDSVSVGVRVDETITSDGNDEVFLPGDTLDIIAIFQNLLRSTTNLVCTLTSTSPYVSVVSTPFNVGVLNTMDTISNRPSPFKLLINQTAPLNTVVDLRIAMSDGSWSDVYGFKVTVNVDYVNIAVNDIATSISSKSIIGYNDAARSQGFGFTYKGSKTLLYEMGLMVGATGTQVSDNVRNSGAAPDADFGSVTAVSAQEPGPISDFDVNGVFSDYNSPSPLNLLITHRAFAWIDAPDNKYVMVDYSIKNTGSTTLTNLFAGLCADWDIDSFPNNKASVDNVRRMGYVWSTDAGGLYAAMKLLSRTGGFTHYALDNEAGGGGINLSDGVFSDSEKYQALSTSRSDAGAVRTTGNDVLDVVSSGPFNLAAGDSVTVSFALIGGENLNMLQESADAAQAKYDSLFVGLLPISLASGNILEQNFPNPVVGNTRIEFSIKESAQTELILYNALGKKVKTILNEKLSGGKYSIVFDAKGLPAGIYYYSLHSGSFLKTLSLTVVE